LDIYSIIAIDDQETQSLTISILSKTSIKLTQSLQHNRIKVAQKFNAFLLLIYCSIPDLVAPANSEETMAVLAAIYKINVSTVTKKNKKN